MPETICFPPIRGTVMRLTRLSNCGVPVVGPCSVITTDGFITAKMTPQYEGGTETIVKNAAGALAINDKAPDVLKNYDVELTFVGVNPDALEMLAGYEALLDNNGDTVGTSYGESVTTDGTAVEVWTDIAGISECAGGVQRYGYLLLPFTTGYRVTSDITIQNDAVNAVVQGLTKRGAAWGTGPFDVVMNGVGTPAAGPLLTPITASEHMRLLTTTVAPPVVTGDCGCTALAA
jgi:hypothetical protein